MAGASVIHKTFKLAFKVMGTDVSFSVGAATGANLATNIGQNATVDVVKTFLQNGASVAAVCIAGKIIHQAWSWITPSSVKATGELEVAIEAGKNENLQQLLASGEISRKVKDGFDDLENKLKLLLGEEVFDQVGKQVMDLIGGYRVDSVQMKGSDLPEDLTAMKVVLGSVKRTNTNTYNFFAAGKDAKGRNIQELVGPGASVTEELHGGGVMMFAGYEGDDLKTATDAFQNTVGGYIPVKILIEGTDKMFERKFKPTTTINEIGMTLIREEKKFYSIFRGDTKLPLDLTLVQASQDGSTVNWTAKEG